MSPTESIEAVDLLPATPQAGGPLRPAAFRLVEALMANGTLTTTAGFSVEQAADAILEVLEGDPEELGGRVASVLMSTDGVDDVFGDDAGIAERVRAALSLS